MDENFVQAIVGSDDDFFKTADGKAHGCERRLLIVGSCSQEDFIIIVEITSVGHINICIERNSVEWSGLNQIGLGAVTIEILALVPTQIKIRLGNIQIILKFDNLDPR